MNNEYLERAREVIPDAKVLIVLASKRARMLASGAARPMVRCKEENFIDVALLEIAEGKLEATWDDDSGNDILKELADLKAAAGANAEDAPKSN